MVNHVQAVSGPFRLGENWRILEQVRGPCGRWPRLMKYVNEPNGFLAPGTYAPVHLGCTYGRFMGCEQWDSRVVSVPASREPSVGRVSIDRTVGELKRIVLQIAKSNRREGRR